MKIGFVSKLQLFPVCYLNPTVFYSVRLRDSVHIGIRCTGLFSEVEGLGALWYPMYRVIQWGGGTQCTLVPDVQDYSVRWRVSVHIGTRCTGLFSEVEGPSAHWYAMYRVIQWDGGTQCTLVPDVQSCCVASPRGLETNTAYWRRFAF